MLAMQYTIQLPVGFAPDQIRERVEQRSVLFDDLPGLVHKAFLFCSRDHLYAPFYIWNDLEAAQKFLLDDLFKGVVDTFQRPRVRNWMVLSVKGMETPKGKASFAIREVESVAAETNLTALIDREKETQQSLTDYKNFHYSAIGLDTDRWELVRYSLWKDASDLPPLHADCIQTYDALHISAPHRSLDAA